MTNLYCLGDSLTFGPGVRVGQKWTTLASSDTLHLVNLGVPGDTTSGMLARVQRLLEEPARPAVLVMGGTNDIFFSGTDAAARSNLAAIVHQLSAAGFRPLVGIPLPIAAEYAPQKWAALADFQAAAATLDDYRAWLFRFCAAFDIPTVNFYKDYVNPDGSVRRELFADGLHPNAEGHKRMAARLLEVLK